VFELLETKINAVTNPVRRTELQQHLEAVKERRKEFNSEFRKARYDALLDDVRREWNALGN